MGKSYFEHPYRSLATLAGLLLLSFLMLEGWMYYIKPSPVKKDDLYKTSLAEADRAFQETQTQLIRNSRELSGQLHARLQAGHSQQNLFQTLRQYNSFWGATLYQDSVPVVWDGFSFSEYPRVSIPSEEEIYVDVLKQNNVIMLLCRISFAVEDSSSTIPYELFTSKRIEQKNALPIGKDREYNFLTYQTEDLPYPVELAFFKPLPASSPGYIILSTTSNDSVGVVYAPAGKFEKTLSEWEKNTWFWRSFFSVMAYIVLSLFFYLWFEAISSWSALFYQLAIILTAWIFFSMLSVPELWLADFSNTFDLLLADFAWNSIFVFLIAITISRQLKKRRGVLNSFSFLRTISLSGLYGLLNVAVIYAGISQTYLLLIETDVQLFDLQIFPNLPTFVLYLSLGLLLFSLGYSLASIGYYLLRSAKDQYKLVVTISISTFVIGLLLSQLYLPQAFTVNWSSWLSLAVFGGVLFVAVIQLNSRQMLSSFSLLRGLAICSFFIALLGLPILKNVQFARLDNQLMRNAKEFLNEEDPVARTITEQILTELEQEFRGIGNEDLDERVPFLQSKFTQTIEQAFSAEWRTYSLNLQLIKPSGKLIADYSTDLNAPNWTNVYDIGYLSAATDIERITKSTNRPIVQLPDLENSENYETFYRGWIPIFGLENNDRIAWILCSVYHERPDFNKPIRAVLASLTYTDWEDSYQMQEYLNGELKRGNKRGVVGRYPRFNVLREAEKRALTQDSVIYYTSTENQQTYRNLLYRPSQKRVAKISTIYPDIKNSLFSFFRFSFTLLLAGLVVIPLFYALTHNKLVFWGSSKRFEHRILDSFLLATLLFLGLLIIATHHVIKKQNEEIVRQELFDKLEGLADATENNSRFQRSIQTRSEFTLDSLASPLNVDAAFYEGTLLKESTTPQIYQQHLLPTSLPFAVYYDLYSRQRRESRGNVTLASQNLLIGYRSLLSPDEKPVAVIAIPTFIQSPKYDRQLLETTSYLIIFYLFTFGVFVLATTFISKQLTRPLRSIQKGLNKISKGDLNTTIPVKTEDEIGSLVQAYNEMVVRLKEVREELAIAEREAAWKEMAQQVAHEIKNPLTPMKLNVQHLERQISGNNHSVNELKSRIKKITKNLIEQIQTLNTIASDFSKFSKPIDEEFTRVNVNEILCSVADLYKHDRKTDVLADLTEYPIFVNGAPDELRRVFINLIKNSFEAMPDGGAITLKSYIKEGSAFFEVEDNGTGISEEDKSKIFVPNFSTKSSGTGLGLAICKKIIEAHNGTITFASIEGKGTTFVIKTPLFKS